MSPPPQDGVSEGEFMAVIAEELPLVRSTSTFTRLPYAPVDGHCPGACVKLGFSPTITLVIVSRGHKTLFFPSSDADADRSGNCSAGTVIDSGIVRPTDFSFYLYGHAGQLGTSKPAHYTVLLDENNFTYVVPSRSQLDAETRR